MCEVNDYGVIDDGEKPQVKEYDALEKIFSDCDPMSLGKVSVSTLIDYMRNRLASEGSTDILKDLRKPLFAVSSDGEVTRNQFKDVSLCWLAKIYEAQNRTGNHQDGNNNLHVDKHSDVLTDENLPEKPVSKKIFQLERTITCDCVESKGEINTESTKEWSGDYRSNNAEDSEQESDGAVLQGFLNLSTSTVGHGSERCESPADNFFGDISAVEGPGRKPKDEILAETTQDLRLRVHRCSVDNDHLREELQRADETIGSLESQLNAAWRNLEKSSKTCERLQEELEEQKELFAVTERERKALATRNHRLEKENSVLKKDIDESEFEIRRLNAELDKVSQRKFEYEKLLANHRKELLEERVMHEEAKGEISRFETANIRLSEEFKISKKSNEHFQVIIKELETKIAELQRNKSCIPLIETSFGSDYWPEGEGEIGQKLGTTLPRSLCEEMRASGFADDPDDDRSDEIRDIISEEAIKNRDLKPDECIGAALDAADRQKTTEDQRGEPLVVPVSVETEKKDSSLVKGFQLFKVNSNSRNENNCIGETITDAASAEAWLDSSNSSPEIDSCIHSTRITYITSSSSESSASDRESESHRPNITINSDRSISVADSPDASSKGGCESQVWRNRDTSSTEDSSEEVGRPTRSEKLQSRILRSKKSTNLQTTPRASAGERKYEDHGSDVVASLNSYLEKLSLKTNVEAADNSRAENDSAKKKPEKIIEPGDKQRRSSWIIYSEAKSNAESESELEISSSEKAVQVPVDTRHFEATFSLPSNNLIGNSSCVGNPRIPGAERRCDDREISNLGSRSVLRSTMSSEEDSSDSECNRDRIEAKEELQVVSASPSSSPPPPPPPPPPSLRSHNSEAQIFPQRRIGSTQPPVGPDFGYTETLFYPDQNDERISNDPKENNCREIHKNGETLRRSLSDSDFVHRFRNGDRGCECGWNGIRRRGVLRPQRGAGDNEDEKNIGAFPSLPDRRLVELGLADTSDGRNLCERMNEDDLERKYTALSLGLETDRVTLPRRLALGLRHRDQAERNLAAEVEKMQRDVQALAPLCVDRETVERIDQVRNRLEMITRCALRVSCTAELLGATHQERRVSRATLLADRYLQALRARCEKLATELAETKRILTENNIFVEENPNELIDDVVPRIRYRVVPSPSRAPPMSKRRASIATITRPSTANPLEATKDNARPQRTSVSGRMALRRPSLTYDTQRWDSGKLDRTDSSSSSIGELRDIFEQAESRRGSREENNNLIRTQLSNLSFASCDSGDSDFWANSREDSVSQNAATREEESPERNQSSFRIPPRILRTVRHRCSRLPIFWYALFVVVFFFGFYSNRYVATKGAAPLKWWSIEEILKRNFHIQRNNLPPI